MTKVVRTIEFPARLDAAVERMAKDTRRTPSDIVSQAVERMIADSNDLAIDMERWAAYERTGVSISLEEAEVQIKKSIRSRRRRTKSTA